MIEGMKFYLIKIKDVFIKAEVTDVERHKSTTRIVSISSSGENNKEIKPEVGWEFSSKLPQGY